MALLCNNLTNTIIMMLMTLSISAVQASPVNVWPKPRFFSWPHPQSRLLSPSFNISAPSHRHLSAAVHRYLLLVLSEHHRPLIPPSLSTTCSSPLRSLTVTVADIATPLRHAVNESYHLTIPAAAGSAQLAAATPWGAMRGLETFSQLVWGAPSRVAAGVFVADEPIFAHRGVLLDTSRNYYGVEDILRTIGAMSANKLNVFHWHITDSQSFPMMLPSEPELAAKGAYGEQMLYSPADVRRIVEFGLEHGVRVMPEIDAPGHAGSWGVAYPEIVSCANMFWFPAEISWNDRLANEPGTGQLNPLNPKTYQVVRNVIKDIATLFPEPFYHAGADEIVPGCWKADPQIQSFLSLNGTLSDLLQLFINSTLPFIVSQNRTAVYYEDVLFDGTINVDPKYLPQDHTVLQTWLNGPKNTKKIASAGYRVIVSSAEFYYLDCGHGSFMGNDSRYDQPSGSLGDGGSWCGPYKTWEIIYNYDIRDGLSEEEAKLVIGGEVALWSEQADPSVLDARLWPRSAALAEALWSGNRDETGKKRYAEATDRLNEWRYRLVSRGIGAEPIQPLWCIRNPGMCNIVHTF